MILKNASRKDIIIVINNASFHLKSQETKHVITEKNISLDILSTDKTKTKISYNSVGLKFWSEDDISCKIMSNAHYDLNNLDDNTEIVITNNYLYFNDSIFYSLFTLSQNDSNVYNAQYELVESPKAKRKYYAFFLFAEHNYFIPFLFIAEICCLVGKEWAYAILLAIIMFFLIFRMLKFWKKYTDAFSKDNFENALANSKLLPEDYMNVIGDEIIKSIKRRFFK